MENKQVHTFFAQKDINRSLAFSVAGYIVILFYAFVFRNFRLPVGGLVFIQVAMLLSFLFMYYQYVDRDYSLLKRVVLFYQLFWIIYLYIFYVNEYGSPLGFMAGDSYTYNKYAVLSQDMSVKELVSALKIERNFNYSDWGFFIFLKYVYLLPGSDIFNVKIINIILNYLTAIMIYKIALWTTIPKVAKNVLLLFGMNPVVIYFASTGLKEVLFLFIIVSAFYYLYKFSNEKEMRYLIIGFGISILMIFFRPLLFIFFIVGWAVYFFFMGRAQDKIVYRIFFIIFMFGVTFLIYRFLQEEIQLYFAYDQQAMEEERWGSATGSVEASQFGLINRVVGLVGPLPTMLQLGGKDTEILQSMGIMIKAFLSIFNLYFFFLVVVKRLVTYYPMCIFIALTILMMIFSSSSFDMRFHYTYLPFFILSAVVGIDQMTKNKQNVVSFVYFVGIFFTVFYWNQRK